MLDSFLQEVGETLPLVVFIPDYLKREPWDAQPSSTELLLDFTMAEYAALLGHPVLVPIGLRVVEVMTPAVQVDEDIGGIFNCLLL